VYQPAAYLSGQWAACWLSWQLAMHEALISCSQHWSTVMDDSANWDESRAETAPTAAHYMHSLCNVLRPACQTHLVSTSVKAPTAALDQLELGHSMVQRTLVVISFCVTE